MENPTKQTWLAKFGDLPLSVKIVSMWMYLNSLGYWFSLVSEFINSKGTIELSALGAGLLFWWTANGLVDKNNFFRILAIFLFWVGALMEVVLISVTLLPGGFDTNPTIKWGTHRGDMVSDVVFISWLTGFALLNVLASIVILKPQNRILFKKSTSLQETP